MTRGELLAALARAVERPGTRRVGIDGPDAAGKTTVADELAAVLRASERVVERLCLDDFGVSAAERYRRGDESPLGYYEDGFDYGAARAAVATRAAGVLVCFDGVFLLRPELADLWDVHVFVTVSPDEAVRRARARDLDRWPTPDAVERRYRRRYLPAQALYAAAERPAERADFVIDNENPAEPRLVAALTPPGAGSAAADASRPRRPRPPGAA